MGYDSRLDRLAATSWYPFLNNVTARGEIMEPYSLTLDEACHFLKISRPTAINWIRTGRLQATRKDPTKNKSPYLTTRQACIVKWHTEFGH
ncbi:helix-turn-helix domain-containing protein, partial [Shigella flexneri]|nr:helix-turn-helix domain-containing protein [Shigella flexneri]